MLKKEDSMIKKDDMIKKVKVTVVFWDGKKKRREVREIYRFCD